MRFRDFKVNKLNEVKISGEYWNEAHKSHDAYIPKLVDKIEAGEEPITVMVGKKDYVQVTFDDAQRKKALEIIKAQVASQTNDSVNVKDKIEGTTTDGEPIKFSPLAIDKTSVKSSVNAGNVTEGVLGFALAARFARTSTPITEAELVKIGKGFFNSGKSEINVKVADRTDDRLKLKVTLPRGDLKALELLMQNEGDGVKVQKELGLTSAAGKKLDTIISQAVMYANEGMAPKGALEKIVSYYQDGIKQTISVVSDGAEAENQNMTKVDLSLEVDPETGKTETLSLLSLKAGGGRSQIGQASGRGFNKLALFWRQSFAYELPENFKATFEKAEQENTDENGKFVLDEDSVFDILNGPILETYEWAEEKIEQHLRGDYTEGEVDFLRHLQKGLLYHSGKHASREDPSTKVKGSEDVIVTILNAGAGKPFLELRFGEKFYNIMQYFDLETSGLQRQSGNTGIVLQVKVKPVANIGEAPQAVQEVAKKLGKNNTLCQYRSYIQGGTTIRNIVEVDAAAKLLASLQYENILEPGEEQSAGQDDQISDLPPQPEQPKATNDPNAKV
jgi:hypothetical protein